VFPFIHECVTDTRLSDEERNTVVDHTIENVSALVQIDRQAC
jgi:hypothetical protein